MRKFIIVLIVLLLLTPALWSGLYLMHPKATVGIVLVDDCPAWGAEAAAEGLACYDDYFVSELLPERFNSSGVRVKEGFTLNSDYFKLGRPGELRERYGVDIILFVTDNCIRNWDEDGGGVWGQADVESGAALMTILPWYNDTPANRPFVRHLALHEVMHLMGYPHNGLDPTDMMQYGGNLDVFVLSPAYEVQLPLRVCIYSYLFGLQFDVVVLLTNVAFSLLLLPWLIATGMTAHALYRRFGGARVPSRVLPAICVVVGFFMISADHDALWVLALPPLLMLFSYQAWYLVRRFLIKEARPRKGSNTH